MEIRRADKGKNKQDRALECSGIQRSKEKLCVYRNTLFPCLWRKWRRSCPRCSSSGIHLGENDGLNGENVELRWGAGERKLQKRVETSPKLHSWRLYKNWEKDREKEEDTGKKPRYGQWQRNEAAAVKTKCPGRVGTGGHTRE